MTPAELRKLADETEKRAATLSLEVTLLREQAAMLRAKADSDERRMKEAGLHLDTPERTIRVMDVNTHGMADDVKRGAARATRKHPAQKRLYRKGVTITKLAAELKEGRPRVSAWFAEGAGNRPIPRRHAEHLREKYGIPLSDWSRVAD